MSELRVPGFGDTCSVALSCVWAGMGAISAAATSASNGFRLCLERPTFIVALALLVVVAPLPGLFLVVVPPIPMLVAFCTI